MGSPTWCHGAGPPERKQQKSDFELRAVSKVADEDVTTFGEELQDLHIDTLTTKLDPAMRQDYQRALDAYENAKSLMRTARRPEDVTGVTKALEDGRYAKACVLARQSGEALPERRPPCFFNPAHGPAHTEVEWAPLGGVAREIPVCLEDANRLAQGTEPEARMVRSGSKMVPWYEAGPHYAAYATGYYGSWARDGLFPAFVLGTTVGSWDSGGWVAPAGYDGGYDGGGWGGGDSGGGHGGGDWGGGGCDGGGFDGGGGGGGGGGSDPAT